MVFKHVDWEVRIKYLRAVYVLEIFLKLLYAVQALPTLCTHATHCVTKWYVSHTNNAVAAAVGACWVGFLCQWRSFRAGRWMIEGEGMGRKVSALAQIQRPCFERAESRWQFFFPPCVCGAFLLRPLLHRASHINLKRNASPFCSKHGRVT